MLNEDDITLDFARKVNFSEILTNPILDIAARVWEDDRYEAFKTCYRSMRRIDDLVDDRKATAEAISRSEAARFRSVIYRWLEKVRSQTRDGSFLTEFLDQVQHFAIPLWPWERLCRAMAYDLEHDGFADLRTFLRYSEGAAVAPASIFMHLCGVRPGENGYRAPEYDIRSTARPLARFSYLVHIIRDFQKDQSQNLNYFADNILRKCNLDAAALRTMADKGEPDSRLRSLIGRYVEFGRHYRTQARAMIDRLACVLQPRYHLSLEIIYGLYGQIYDLIDPEKGCFTAAELNPTPSQVQARIKDIIAGFVPIRNS